MEEPKLIKKNYKEIIRQKRSLIFITMIALLIVVAPSYALLSNFKKLDNAVNIKAGNMNMSITTNGLVSLTGKLPETDASLLYNATEVPIILKN